MVFCLVKNHNESRKSVAKSIGFANLFFKGKSPLFYYNIVKKSRNLTIFLR